MKNIVKDGNQYVIYHSVNGKRRCYGRFDLLSVAQKVRDLLVLHDWGQFKTDTKYIHHRRGRFEITRRIDGKTKYFGSYDSLKEAQKVRNELIMNDWGVSFE